MTSSSTTTYHHEGFFPNDDNSNPQQGAAYHHHYYYQQQQNQQQYHSNSKSQRSTTTTSTSSNPNRGLSRDDRKLFVGGLPSNITSIEFETFFQQFGSLVDSVVMFDRDTHRSRGFGFVTYEDVSVCHKLLMMGNEESNPSDVMSLIGRIEMQGKICEIKAATPRELNGNRGFRRNHHNTNHMTTQEEESKKTIPETSSSSTAPNNNNKAIITPKATPTSFFPAMYPYPPIPPNQGHPTHFPHPNAFYYPPSFPVYVPPHMEYPPISGGYANPVPAYVENSFPNEGSDQTSLSQQPNTVTFGDKQPPNEPDATLAPSKSPTPNTKTIDKGVITPTYPPMIHTMGYPLVSATPTLLIPPIPPASQGSMPIPMTTTSAIPVVPEHIPYIPTTYGGMIPGAAGALPPLSLPPHPPFHLPAASSHVFREGDTYPPPYPYYPTASAVAMGPWEPVPYGVIPPPPPTNPAPTQSEETMG